MTRAKKTAAKAHVASEVDAFMSRLEHPRKAEIEALRKIILGVDRCIAEGIKWNAPSFAIGEHFATFKRARGDGDDQRTKNVARVVDLASPHLSPTRTTHRRARRLGERTRR